MDTEKKFNNLFLAAYDEALRKNGSVVVETVKELDRPNKESFDGKKIVWRGIMGGRRETMITWVGTTEK